MKIKLSFAFLALTVVLISCQSKFQKGEGGMEYKIISKGKGDVIKDGNTFEFTPYAVYTNKDSMLVNEDSRVNQLVKLDSGAIPPQYYKIFKQVREGDSVVIRERTDSILAKGAQVPWIKKGFYIIQSFKIQKFYKDSVLIVKAQESIMKMAVLKDSVRKVKQIAKDDVVIKEYLTKNKINAKKAELGTYVEIITPGTTPITDSVGVKINYTGKSFEGKSFDSNTDPQFGHVEPYLVYMAQPEVIKGWTDGLKQLGKGAKARFYIPSALAYGAQGNGEKIKPNENLMFDIEIVDVLNKAQAEIAQKQEMARRQAQMMQMQQQQMQQQKGK